MTSLLDPSVSLCACGCGSTFSTLDSRGRPRRFQTGHNMSRRYALYDGPPVRCACGCGASVKLANRTDARLGWVRGQPLTCVRGHTQTPRPAAASLPAEEEVAIRLCACGCCRATAIATYTSRKDGIRRGERLTYIKGHNGRYAGSELDRFWSHVSPVGGCLLWTGSLNRKGYGVWSPRDRKRSRLAHRWLYEETYGPIPADRDVGHNCPGGDIKRCIDPTHMLLLTRAEHGMDRIREGQTT